MASLTLTDFLDNLFIALDLHQIRYCVLHSYAGLPDELTSDLDMALHPRDAAKLGSVFDALRGRGYHPLQCINYSAGGGGSHYFVFGWSGVLSFMTAAIDFTCEHREGGVILMSGEELVGARRKHRKFWIPDPAIEFQYLLAKKLLKGVVGAAQAERLKSLAQEIGREAAERAAGRLVKNSKGPLVDACLNNTLESQIPAFRRYLVQTVRRYDPMNRVRYLATEWLRLCGRMFRPTGLCVAVLGPDGVGKSTLLPLLLQRIGGCFRMHSEHHWRPQLFRRHKGTAAVQAPHGRMNFSAYRSVLHLIGHTVDFILGYCLLIYPVRVKSGLVLFDRHFDDLMIDPERYRYGGPRWLPGLLRGIVPAPELTVILEAPAETVLARKQELSREGIVRLSRAYRNLAYQSKSARIIDAAGAPEVVAERVVKVISDHLAARFRREHPEYTGDASERSSAQLEEALKWLADAGGQTGGSADPAGKRKAFAVVPSRRDPRWIIPIQGRSSSLVAMRMYTPYTNRARLFKHAVSLALKFPARALPGDQISLMAEGSSPLDSLVADKLGITRPVFGISFGTSGHHRKLTVQVMSEKAEILAYIKIPMTATGSERVRHEASVLKRLAAYPLLRAHIPTLLFAGEWQGRFILIQDALGGSTGPARLTRAHFHFLQTLWNAQPTERPGESIVDEVSHAWSLIGDRLDARWNQLGEEALDVARRRIEGISVPCGITHGDFAPWNTRTENGQLSVFDWECANWSHPTWWDIFHFETQSSTLLNHTPRKALPRGDPRTFRTIYMLYLLASTCQILRDEPTNMDGLQYRRERLAAELLRTVHYVAVNSVA